MSTPQTVFDRLRQSQARLEALLEAGRGRAAAIWSNDVDRVRYEDTALHTVSLYLDHGEESRRLDRGAIRGHAGALCLMPQGSWSDWAIGGRFRFVHLYLDDGRLRRFAAETLDRDPARVDLPDLTYYDEPVLAAAMRRLARSCRDDDVFAAEAVIAEICHRLLTAPVHGGLADRPIKGGLAPAVSRRAIERMRDRLDDPPTLDELAAEAGLSPFHFQRMFRASHGVSPHRWIEALRVEEAKRLMRAGDDLAEVAAACGWCHQSAFTRTFRAATGLTPGAWRTAAVAAGTSTAAPTAPRR
jgi:AraC family transcriptional regulator